MLFYSGAEQVMTEDPFRSCSCQGPRTCPAGCQRPSSVLSSFWLSHCQLLSPQRHLILGLKASLVGSHLQFPSTKNT